ncbi:hypothetical protein ACFLW6_03335 [Chloroflexota bacterium]
MERMVPYIRASFWAGRTFASLDEINKELLNWCLRVAGLLTHGTTRQRPFEVFRAVKQAGGTESAAPQAIRNCHLGRGW